VVPSVGIGPSGVAGVLTPTADDRTRGAARPSASWWRTWRRVTVAGVGAGLMVASQAAWWGAVERGVPDAG
jgi:hypothetical protein